MGVSERERGEADQISRISRSDNQHAAAVGSVVKNKCQIMKKMQQQWQGVW